MAPPPPPPEEIAQLMRFIAAKVKNVKSPMNIKGLVSQFKEETGSLLSVNSLKQRIEKSRLKIHKMNRFDNDTKVMMIFALSAPIEKGFLNKLMKQAEVEVDEKGRIIDYQSNAGSLKLEGRHGMSSIKRSMHSDRWRKICQKANDDESEEEDQDSNRQKCDEKKRVDLVRFLIERTKNATFPLNIDRLAKDYKKEFKCSESQHCIHHRITSFRQRIHEINQFDKPTKVKMLFALSASVHADLLQKLQKDAVVELDENQKIKIYMANDGSLVLEGDHTHSIKVKATWANKKKKSVVNVSSDSEEGEEEKDSCETDGSDEERGGDTGDSVKSNQASRSLSKRRNKRIRKSKASTQNFNKRPATAQNQSRMSSGRKRAKIFFSSSEASDDDEESTTLENSRSMDSETTNNFDNGGDDFDYDLPINDYYNENLEHNVTDPNLERDIEPSEVRNEMEEEEKKEESSANSSAKIESMSLLELLNHLRSPIAQYTPNLVAKIGEKIKQLEEKDKQIPFGIIIESLEMCIQILNTPDEMDPDEDTSSLCDFFYRLERAMRNITHSMMNDVHLKIENLAWADDAKISMEHIRYAIGKTLDKILH